MKNNSGAIVYSKFKDKIFLKNSSFTEEKNAMVVLEAIREGKEETLTIGKVEVYFIIIFGAVSERAE